MCHLRLATCRLAGASGSRKKKRRQLLSNNYIASIKEVELGCDRCAVICGNIPWVPD